jgi:DNA mismatch repair protein MutS2
MSIDLLKDAPQNTLNAIDWDGFSAKIANLAHFEESKNLLILPPTLKTPHEISLNYERFDLLNSFGAESIREWAGHYRHLNPHFNVEHTLEQIEKNEILGQDSLWFFYQIMESFRSLDKKLNFLSFFNNNQFKDILKVFKKYKSECELLFNENGEINYLKHPLLAPLFKKEQILNQKIRTSISFILRSNLFKNAVRNEVWDYINDCYVVAIRSDAYKSSLGRIIAYSNSGHTLFVEPHALRDLNNELIEIKSELESQKYKIIKNLFDILHQNQPSISLISSTIIRFDILSSKFIYCDSNLFRRPQFIDDFSLDIRGLFHPLVEDPVLNNINISISDMTLLISGPNTGGKTVLIKSILYCVLLPHYGCYIPAESAHLPLFKSIFFLGPDNQDLKKGLSSFGAQANYFLDLVSEIQDDSIILVDEIFNSTSSEEASALSYALINHLKNVKRQKLFITSHHNALKRFCFNDPDCASGHMEFCSETRRPLYRFQQGSPGNSYALEIFEEIEKDYHFSFSISNCAKEFLKKDSTEFETILSRISEKENQLNQMTTSLQQRENEIIKREKSLKGTYQLKLDEELKQFKKKLSHKSEKLERLMQEIKKGALPSKNQIFKEISKAKSTDDILPSSKEDVPTDTFQRAEEISSGATYFSYFFKSNVTVEKVNIKKKQALVLFRGKRSWIPINTLQNKLRTRDQEILISRPAPNALKLEYDFRGVELDEFQKSIEFLIYSLISGDIPFLQIIHGHGNGVLKKHLRGYLKTFKEIDWKPEDGNDGCTEIKLKE